MAEDYTVAELARNLQALEQRMAMRMSELHADNRGAMAEINTSIQRQTDQLVKQNGRVTALEYGHRSHETRVTELEGDVEAMQRKATAAATASATQAIHDTAPSRSQMVKTSAVWNGVTSGAIIGSAYVLKMIAEALMALAPHVKP